MESHQLNNLESTEKYLTDNGIVFHTIRHEAAATNVELQANAKFEGAQANTVLAKQLFLYDKKKKENVWLVCADVKNEFDLKLLAKHLGVGASNLRGADEVSLKNYLGCVKGMVNYFSMINDTDKKVKVIVDQRLIDAEFASFHPMDNSASTAVTKEGILKLKELSGRDDTNFAILDFSTLQAAAGATAAAPQQKKQKDPKKKVEQGKKLTAEEKKKRKEDEKATKNTEAHELGITYKKEANFSKWYSDVIVKGEMIDYYDISGCYVLRPRAYFVWEQIQQFMDPRFKELGVSNCYFPMFVSQDALEKEKDHLEGFSPEVAWVTRSGQSELEKPIAIRPTSETIMYPQFARWINSHRDLPLKINQWSNVVRWEFKHPTPFIRTREFLWQEGHTAHQTEEEATQQVMDSLEIYATCYEQLLAVPVVRGKKSEDERFAGAYFTTTTEIYVPVSGRGIQGATSHQLGQNFSKMFNVEFLDAQKEKKHCWQTSWGLSTRSIGAMIMVHSDNKGLVMPPRVAQQQVVIIPIEKTGQDNEAIRQCCEKVYADLKKNNIRVHFDDRDNYNPGWKFNNWEMRGVPIRLEIGGKDLEKNEVRCVKRNDGNKQQLSQDGLADSLKQLLTQIHDEMYQKALASRESHVRDIDNWKDFMDALNGRNLCMAPWCNVQQCEIDVKERSKEESLKAMEEANEEEALLTGSAKTLCIPIDQSKKLADDACCFACGKKATVTALWGRSY